MGECPSSIICPSVGYLPISVLQAGNFFDEDFEEDLKKIKFLTKYAIAWLFHETPHKCVVF